MGWVIGVRPEPLALVVAGDTLMSNFHHPISVFQQKLDSDPKLAVKCDAVAKRLREAASPYIRACESAERFTREDFANLRQLGFRF